MKLGVESAVSDLVMSFKGIPVINDFLKSHNVAPATSLEAACGSGKLSIHLALRHGTKITMLDIDPEMVFYAAHLAGAVSLIASAAEAKPYMLHATALEGDVHDLHEFPDNAFELVFNEGIMEHFPRAEQLQILHEMTRVSSRWVFIVVPDADVEENQRIAREVHHHYEGMPAHETPLTMNEVYDLLTESGLKVVDIQTGLMNRLIMALAEKKTETTQ